MNKYVLNEKGEPELCADLYKWAEWFECGTSKRRVAHDKIGESNVSTVFLGLDHGFAGDVILWETMVFGGPRDHYQERCGGSREQAEAMHQRVIELVKTEPLTPPPLTPRP